MAQACWPSVLNLGASYGGSAPSQLSVAVHTGEVDPSLSHFSLGVTRGHCENTGASSDHVAGGGIKVHKQLLSHSRTE